VKITKGSLLFCLKAPPASPPPTPPGSTTPVPDASLGASNRAAQAEIGAAACSDTGSRTGVASSGHGSPRRQGVPSRGGGGTAGDPIGATKAEVDPLPLLRVLLRRVRVPRVRIEHVLIYAMFQIHGNI
jgi:hypothetical protein